ncbi:rRNA maturation RNase YbeY [Gimesia maris]|uniref:rRNA maturation RNase YbeY n=1 Tax=Gimesia maris TaxID=122 RepID=UPI0030DBE24C|tara:strand:- start:138884 stop:139381 length:498 start_codon:yes stop_codon:yes gene_type:complete
MNTIDQFQIEIQNSQTHLAIDETQLKTAISFLLQSEQVNQAEISLAIVDNPTIRQLNQQYLEHDYDTDVLSFLLDCDTAMDTNQMELRGAGRQIEGEVIVSAEMAVVMSAEYQWPAEQELLLYVIHGLLHLCGYDDLTEEELHIMRQREQQIFDHWQISIPRREE